MKTLKWISSALMVTLLMTSCFIDVDDDGGLFNCVDGDGPIITEEIFLDDFDGIRIEGEMNVFLKQGPNQEVIVEGKENLIDELERDVNGGIWNIDFDGCVRDIDEFNIFITIPDLTVIRIDGSGDVVTENLFVIEDLEIDIEGSGDIDLVLEADDINTSVEGSGDIRLEGQADEVRYRIEGSGDVKAYGLECRVADINVAGSGDLEVFVTEYLKVRIEGSGSVFYRGNPELDVFIDGSGDVVDDN